MKEARAASAGSQILVDFTLESPGLTSLEPEVEAGRR